MSTRDHERQVVAPAESGVVALCAEYDYPGEVAEILHAVLAILSPLAPRSVLLHGSAARGELTWWRGPDGGVSLGSDLEMDVVTDRVVSSAMLAEIQARIERLQNSVSGGAVHLFHIDLGCTTPAGLGSRPRTFRTWDTRTTGRTISGEDMRGALPELEASTIDLLQLNEVPIHRLWEMTLRAPRRLLTGGASPAEVDAFRLVCSRQALDLTTWLLPHLGLMVPTFRRRVEVWTREFERLPLKEYFDADSSALLTACLRGKLRLEFTATAQELHGQVLEHFMAALRMVLELAPTADLSEIADAAVGEGSKHWNVENARRRAYEAYLLLRDRQFVSPIRACRWWRRPKKPLQVAFLLHLNRALQELLRGEDAGQALDLAEQLLSDLWYGYGPRPGLSVERFLAVRRGYVEYLVGTSRWFGPRRDYLFSIID